MLLLGLHGAPRPGGTALQSPQEHGGPYGAAAHKAAERRAARQAAAKASARGEQAKEAKLQIIRSQREATAPAVQSTPPQSSLRNHSAAAGAAPSAELGKSPHGKPHLVMAVIDDLGYGDVPWSNDQVHLPVLDKLAQAGTILERHYAYHVCGPSRDSLLSGRLPVHANQYNWPAFGADRRMTLLPEVLGRVGYKNVAVGKWDLGYISTAHLPNSRGFHRSFCMLGTHADHWSHHGINQFPKLPEDKLDLWEDDAPAKVACIGHL